MNIQKPLPLYHSWPLFEARERLAIPILPSPFSPGANPCPRAILPVEVRLAAQGIGVWECDLADNDRLSWSRGVYDLFGLPHGEEVERPLAASLYTPASRPVMEELRAYAIRQRRGFTVDANIRQPGGEERWMRLSAVPVIVDGKVVRLCGLKVDVTVEYDSPALLVTNGDARPA